MEAIRRRFNVSYGYALEHSKDKRILFLDDLAVFTAFDSYLDADFAAAWLVDITAAESQISDESVVDDQTDLTAAVYNAMKKCREYYQEVKYYALRAFPDPKDAKKLNKLGFDNYDKARNSQTLMLQFMKDVHEAALKYAVELAAVNFDAAKIAQIDTLRTALDTANAAQNNFIEGRPVATSDRISAYNKMWESVTLVARAAKIVYRNNPAKFNQYLLPGSDEPDEVLSLKGKVIATATGEPIQDAEVKIVELNITVETDSNGKYAFGNIAFGIYELSCSATGYTTANLTNIAIIEDVVTTQNFTLVADSP